LATPYNLALTRRGADLAAKIEQGDGTIPLPITRIVTGSGTSNDPLSQNNVMNIEQTFQIMERRTTGARAIIVGLITNDGLIDGYELYQIGFYALDPDLGEILYRITQFEKPIPVPAPSDKGFTYQPTFNIVTGNASEVIIHIDVGAVNRTEIWNSVEYSPRHIPLDGTRTHYYVIRPVPDYEPAFSEVGPPPEPPDPPDPPDPPPGTAPGLIIDGTDTYPAKLLLPGGATTDMIVIKGE